MNATRITFLLLLFLTPVFAQQTIPIDNFKSISDPMERQRLIEKAPSDEKDQLKQINEHLRVVALLGGEMAFNKAKKEEIIKTRGLISFRELGWTYTNFMEAYMNHMVDVEEKKGMTYNQMKTTEENLLKATDAVSTRLNNDIDSVLYETALTPEASALSKRAYRLIDKMNLSLAITTDNITLKKVTTSERDEVDREVHEIVDQLKHLPKMSPEQIKKEYDAFPDATVAGYANYGLD